MESADPLWVEACRGRVLSNLAISIVLRCQDNCASEARTRCAVRPPVAPAPPQKHRKNSENKTQVFHCLGDLELPWDPPGSQALQKPLQDHFLSAFGALLEPFGALGILFDHFWSSFGAPLDHF